MEVSERSHYLQRLGVDELVYVDPPSLASLHLAHLLCVPFENLDIQNQRPFDLNLEKLFRKIVVEHRGGFCYELNLLFNELLTSLGFQSRIIEARIFTDKGELGLRFDHMSVLVELDKPYLADVGFGDLFLKPLEIKEGEQSDGRNLFKIEQLDEKSYLLLMAKEDRSFERKYVFDLRSVVAEDFYGMCLDKQTNPDSYFVKNLVCTKPTQSGRVTIFNNNLVERSGADRLITKITGDTQLREILRQRFQIAIQRQSNHLSGNVEASYDVDHRKKDTNQQAQIQ